MTLWPEALFDAKAYLIRGIHDLSPSPISAEDLDLVAEMSV